MRPITATAIRMAGITQKYLDKLSPLDRERKVKAFKEMIKILRPTGYFIH